MGIQHHGLPHHDKVYLYRSYSFSIASQLNQQSSAEQKRLILDSSEFSDNE